MANDPAASSSVIEGIIRWCSNDAFSQTLENKPKYVGRVRQVGPSILPVRGNIHTYYTPSQSRSQNTGDSIVSHMLEKIRKLEVENCHQRAQIEELTTQMETKESVYEARFQRLESLFLHGSSSSIIPEVAHPERGNAKLGSPRKVVFVNTTIV